MPLDESSSSAESSNEDDSSEMEVVQVRFYPKYFAFQYNSSITPNVDRIYFSNRKESSETSDEDKLVRVAAVHLTTRYKSPDRRDSNW